MVSLPTGLVYTPEEWAGTKTKVRSGASETPNKQMPQTELMSPKEPYN